MNKAIVMGITALLLGVIVSLPVRARALENTVEKGNVIEGEITQPREINPVTNALLGAMVGPLVGMASFEVGFILMLFGVAFTSLIVGAPLGIPLLILAFIFMFILPIPCVVIGSPIGFILGFGEGMALTPQEIGDFIIRLVDACVPG